MHCIRGDPRQRLEDEPSLVHQRVGDLQIGFRENLIAIEDQVEVDDPRAPFLPARAAEGLLDLK